MSQIALSPNANGAGVFTIASPNSGTNRTLTLPDETGTLTSTASTPTFSGAITAPAFIPNGSSVPSNGEYLPTANTLAWSTNTTERMRVDSSGNVGIGTTSPAGKFHVSTGTYENWICKREGLYQTSFYLAQDGSGPRLYQDASSEEFRIQQLYNSTGYITFYTSTTERARITKAGEIYIAGTTDQGAYNLQCNGTGVWGAGAYVNGSDSRIKEDVAPIDSGLDVVTKLNPVTYRYKEDWSKDQSTQTGFIAQELLVALEGKNYVDGVVQQGGANGYYSVAYQNIIPILTKAIQELNAKVEAQAAEIAALKGTK